MHSLAGPVVDVGSGGGTPGVPLAVALPERSFTLLEAERRKCEFLERVTATLANVSVVWGRAEEQPTDSYGVALAKALAKPPVAAELCLPLVATGGVAILWLGESADRDAVAKVAEKLGARLEGDRGRVSWCSASWARRRPGSPAGPGWRRSVRSPKTNRGWQRVVEPDPAELERRGDDAIPDRPEVRYGAKLDPGGVVPSTRSPSSTTSIGSTVVRLSQ